MNKIGESLPLKVETDKRNFWEESDEDEDMDQDNGNIEIKHKKSKSVNNNLASTATSTSSVTLSVDDYERLLLGSPNDAILWIQYAAFHLQLAEIDRAREVIQKALKTIAFRAEEDRRNVWMAWMNLEAKYGSDTKLELVFKQSILACEPKKMYLHLASVHEQNEQYEVAATLRCYSY